MSEENGVVKTMALSEFAVRRTEAKVHVFRGGVVHLLDGKKGEHVMSIVPPETGLAYERQRSEEVADFEAFKAARRREAREADAQQDGTAG